MSLYGARVEAQGNLLKTISKVLRLTDADAEALTAAIDNVIVAFLDEHADEYYHNTRRSF